MESDGKDVLDFVDDLSDAIDYAVVGPRDSRVHEIRTTFFPFNTICHLGRDFGDGKWRGCTGTLIAPRLVLSAGHCLYNSRMGRSPERIRVAPGRADRDTMPYGSVISTEFYVPRQFVHASVPGYHRVYDFGVIVLPKPFKGINQFMQVRSMTDPQLKRVGRTGLITIAGYPGDRPIGTLWRHSERLKKATPTRLLYSVDTCPGHSGSPIWFVRKGDHKRFIVGVHTSGILDEVGRPYGCSKGAVLAPPGLLNSGVRVTHDILADIRNPNRIAGGERRMVKFP